FGKKSGQPALKIGQFVNAQIQGQSIEGVFVIPNKSIREGHYVYVVRDGLLAKQTINIVWQDDQNALVRDGVSPGELVVTTSLNSTLAGAKAKLPEGFAGSTSQLQETAASDSSSVDRPENLASPVEASATNQ
ncbi:MAG: hypothetical protein HKN50_12665, partial [Gammaproteobacteria bacterium]|nr:hypothetical protein [Gammaproteobacteria bacterium]